jgi:hypothetical protein
MAKLLAPGHISVGGKLYERAEDGTVEVPEEHVEHLVSSHGCQPAPEPDVKRVGKAKKAD